MRGLKYIQALPSREEQESPKAGQAELPVRQGVVLSVLDWRLRAGDTLLREGASALAASAAGSIVTGCSGATWALG